MTVQVITGDCLDVLRTLPEKSVHTCVTSPPYYGLRDYGTADWEGGDTACKHVGMEARTVSGGNGKQYTNEGSNRVYSGDCACGATRIDRQIGLEPTPDAYVARMVEVFREVRRVLRDDGTVWCNLGDGFANKQLVGIPWRVAFALQADGWFLRQDIIWSKPGPMPESVTDRCTKAHEYIFLLSKNATYHYDAAAIAEEAAYAGDDRGARTDSRRGTECNSMSGVTGTTRNKRSVWTVSTKPYAGAHFATFPPDLITPMILAGCPAQCCAECGAPWEREQEIGALRPPASRPDAMQCTGDSEDTQHQKGAAKACWSRERTTTGFAPSCACNAGTVPGTCLDPFGGAGTTGLVADRLQRNAILIELNPQYAQMARHRITDDAPLFAEVA